MSNPHVIDGEVCRDASRPCAKRVSSVESSSRFVNAPKGFNRQIFRHRRVANDPYNPGVHFSLEMPEQLLERVHVSLFEAFEELHFALRLYLRVKSTPHYIFLFMLIAKHY